MQKTMFFTARWHAVLIVMGAAVLAGCADTSHRVANMVTPYRVDVVQGNFVSREQVQALQPGMSRQQVREILGTPLVTSLFHADRWEYVFTLKRPQVEAQTRRLTVFFQDNVMERVEGDEMPSESEFVASLTTKLGKPKVPSLQASEEQLARFSAPPAAAPESDETTPPTPTSYPPLE